MPMDIYDGLVEEGDLLDFSQNFAVTRANYMGSALFPDRKTQYIEAEYTRLCRNGNLPMIAQVHAFDTEAVIGSRIPIEKVEIEKLLIKEKINQTERIREITNGMRMDGVKNYVFDDIARTAEKVVARAEKAKMDAIAKGKFTISENGLSIEVDYGIPEENFVETFWDEDADIIGDLVGWRDIAEANGVTPDRAVTTQAVIAKMKGNKGIQKALFGANGTGTLPTLAQINSLVQEHVGITIGVNEAKYATFGDNGALSQNRFFPENEFVMFATGANGAIGAGLWGVTPEERVQGGAFDAKRQRQFVTVTQWEAPDPTAVWTKASGLFVPVMPNPYGHIIANVGVEPSVDDPEEDQESQG